ncbi:MAG: hypothetical protein N2688_15055, partial [Burkholderiaceae bacterium]|nr:hypothetical protein [Burkholderiaceae bacterium]
MLGDTARPQPQPSRLRASSGADGSVPERQALAIGIAPRCRRQPGRAAGNFRQVEAQLSMSRQGSLSGARAFRRSNVLKAMLRCWQPVSARSSID